MTLYIDTRPKLEWVDKTEKEYERKGPLSRSTNREYYIQRIINEYHIFTKWSNEIEGKESLKAAKSAAQADYEARTAERFKAVELPDMMHDDAIDAIAEHYYNQALRDIYEEIAKATAP